MKSIVLHKDEHFIWCYSGINEKDDECLIYCNIESIKNSEKLVPYQYVNIKYFKILEVNSEILGKVPCWIYPSFVNLKKYEFCNDIEPCDIYDIHHEKSILSGRLEISSKTNWGKNSKNKKIYSFVPLDRSYPRYIVASAENAQFRNGFDVYARVEIKKWEHNETHPKGNLVEILGGIDDESCYELTIYNDSIPRTRKQLEKKNTIETDDNYEKYEYENWTNVPTVTIDPASSRDLDDAISYNSKSKEYAVHIATPTLFFENKNKLHSVAQFQGESIYGSKVHNLLPKTISEEKASLLKNQKKFCLSVVFDEYQNPIRLTKSLIKVDENLTYETQNLCRYFELDDDFDSHKFVADFMIKANSYIALWSIKENSDKCILRGTFHGRAWYFKHIPNTIPKKQETLGTVYTHFTSPIRRYIDQLVHRCILEKDFRFNEFDILQSNKVKYDLNIRHSKYRLLNIKDNEIIDGKFVHMYTHPAMCIHVEFLEDQKENGKFTIPLYGRFTQEFINYRVLENGFELICKYDESKKLTVTDIENVKCLVRRNPRNGIDGFEFEWCQPNINEWILSLILDKN